ncbi:TRAP transporter substrate-binding protein [Nitratireductor luteus]|uniref:TRAP transporter substrate-binding protein n=1 Tax=Nitratireductor luteus TaxID=2976980 RepID=UPI0022409071|nr:TRAP transporter substrate-binding protein [Nitratireductor luteus]
MVFHTAKMTGRRLAVALTTLAAMGLTVAVAQGETLRFGHNQQTNHVYHAVADHFAQEADKRLEGLDIKIFPAAQLGEEVPMLESVMAGVQDMAIAASAWTSTFVPSMGFFSVSYIFPTQEDFRKALNDEALNALIDEKIAESDVAMKRVATITAGVRNLYNAVGAVEMVDDVDGLRLRVMGSPIESQVWGAIGASPFSIPFSDVYTALQTGLAKGAENAAAVYAANKHYEVAPYYSLTGHQWLVGFVFISQSRWDSLTADQQDTLLEIGKEATDLSIDYAAKTDADMLEELVANSGVQVNEVDTDGFVEKVAPIQDSAAEELGMQDVLTRIRELR